MKIKITTKQIAITAIFAAIYAVFRIIPLGPMIGLSASFSLSDSLAPLFGIILGPYLGGLSVIIGTFSAMALGKAPIFLGLDFLPGLINAVALGFLIRKKWLPVIALNVILLGIFLVSPYTLLTVQIGSVPIPFVWMHIIALIFLISPISIKSIKNIRKSNIAYLALSIAVLAFIGTMMQHLTGNLLFQFIFGEPIGGWNITNFHGYWVPIFFAYPIERIALVAIAVLIGTPIVKILKKSVLPFEDPTTDKK
ncbi:MAG: hypothetical protein PHC63_05805 [Candidatus Bathyarchaeota archaeon]|nr:hypothetical protein [Candidatus Bathyarchaeota archaeon]MDI9578567.1 hypothetical protein [Thermoproteota archaeon]NLD65372.1 hypothetical protein [Thermoproteota archaeon]